MVSTSPRESFASRTYLCPSILTSLMLSLLLLVRRLILRYTANQFEGFSSHNLQFYMLALHFQSNRPSIHNAYHFQMEGNDCVCHIPCMGQTQKIAKQSIFPSRIYLTKQTTFPVLAVLRSAPFRNFQQ